jgi:hypothetical protein
VTAVTGRPATSAITREKKKREKREEESISSFGRVTEQSSQSYPDLNIISQRVEETCERKREDVVS